jgi:hypothetical protein
MSTQQPSPFGPTPGPAPTGPFGQDLFGPQSPLIQRGRPKRPKWPWALGAVVLFIVIGLVAGMTLGKDGSSTTTSSTTTATTVPTNPAGNLTQYLLAPADLPAGWSEDPDAEKIAPQSPKADNPACTDAWTKANNPKYANMAAKAYTKAPQVVLTMVTSDTVDNAKATLQQYADAVTKCPAYTNGTAHIAVDLIPAPDTLGDESHLYRVTTTVGPTVYTELDWYSRVGGMIWQWSYAYSGVAYDESTMKTIAAKAIAKWRKVTGG